VGRLDEIDLSKKLSKEEGLERLEKAQDRLLALRLTLGGLLGDGRLGPPVCVMFEGWDASGKGGAIKRLVAPLDPRHARVAQFSAPTPIEKRHHFLWRFWPVLPGWGGVTVCDRPWYGRVLVERVEGFASEEEWKRAYDEINDFEHMLVEEGTLLIKFWMHISSEEQLKRFEERAATPLKKWKLTDDDWKNRGLREQYLQAIEAMFEHTDSKHAPWHIVAAESKQYARVKVVETVNALIEKAMRKHGIDPPS
jgi:AMP-polyphosphate phosphotransferase